MLMHVRAPEQMLYNILLLVTVLVFRSRMNLVVFSVSCHAVAAACKGLNSTNKVLRATRVKN